MHISRVFASVLVLVCFFSELSNGARVLISVSTPSYSHQVAFRTICKKLAEHGHDIVLLTTDPMDEVPKNLRQIDMKSTYNVLKKYDYNAAITSYTNYKFFEFMRQTLDVIGDSIRHELNLPEVQALIHNSSEHFDLLMFEGLFPTHVGFVERFKAPVICIASLDVPRMLHLLMGNDAHMVMHPLEGLNLSYPPTFLERTISVLFNWFMNLYSIFVVNPMMDEIIKDVFGPNSRPINELMKEIDMLFINVNPVLQPIRAVTPNTILFGGGTHVDKVAKPLPEGIKKFLDNATEGAIYFSLGSNVKSALIKQELRQVFIDTLKELPYKVLWKFENEELPNKPDNVMIQKWVPQSDVLKHPNLKAFVTQCGLQSMEEAIMNHIPLVGLPFFADQPANAIIMENKGFGIHLDHAKLTKEIFKDSILEVVNNPKYKNKAIEIADLTTDVQMTGLEKVVWWTEYVIRNKGAKLFRNPIRDLPLYQYYLLDVIGFVSLICFIVTYSTIKIGRLLYKFLRQILVKKSKKD